MNDVGLYQHAAQADLCYRYQQVRDATEAMAAGLTDEDQCIQSMPDASPVKWHRAHTTWFFEQFVLGPNLPGYEVFDPAFNFLFNSYYEAVGPRHPRPSRGMLTRPSVAHVTHFRRHVDKAITQAIPNLSSAVRSVVELGLHHEQQHLELLITDMMHAFAQNPLFPAMMPGWREPLGSPGETRFIRGAEGVRRIGYDGTGFCFDNETPAHDALLHPHAVASHLVRNRDWLRFIKDNGYQTPSLWMSDGFAAMREAGWTAPLHWRQQDGAWFQFGPGGLSPLVLHAPVRHISWYEADAFARWANARLPTEAELESANANPDIQEITGHVWQWTESAYRPYPGYKAAPGAIGEYNGKFMVNQMVLRGGSLATAKDHSRSTYRNFFHPDKRWQFTGLRLAKDF
jgi:ergothioneine biosynthesis protein EgtB